MTTLPAREPACSSASGSALHGTDTTTTSERATASAGAATVAPIASASAWSFASSRAKLSTTRWPPRASFGVLVTLARIEDEGGVSQRRLMDELGLTSGTISVRIDRLVEQGLVERRPDPESKRSALITLTERGRERFERVVPAHLANER